MTTKNQSSFLMECDKKKRYIAVKRGDLFAVIRGGEVIEDELFYMAEAQQMADELNGG